MKKTHFIKSLLFLIIFLFGFKPTPTTIIKGKVVSIKDGDTIEILLSDNTTKRIRLAFIDCPEKKQAYGQKAKEFTSDKCFAKIVTIKCFSVDRYGRSIGEVILPDGKSLNKELIINGYAWQYTQYSNDKELQNLQNQAKNKKLGLWSDPYPIAPWEFRKRKNK